LQSGKREIKILLYTGQQNAFQKVLPADKTRKAPFFMPDTPAATACTEKKGQD